MAAGIAERAGPLALYGAAGVNFDPELTKLLLEAGANPNDALYHFLESVDCARGLLGLIDSVTTPSVCRLYRQRRSSPFRREG